MSNKKFISIVTISYNQNAYLEKCIRSIVDSGDPDVEYIIVDPGSTDGSRDIIHKYRGSINRIILDKDDGPADGLNHGFSEATGEFFAFVNADDFLLPGSIRLMREALASKPGVDVLSGHGYVVDENERFLRASISWPFSASGFLAGQSFLLQQSTFFRRTAFKCAGGFNVKNKTCWDLELWIDMLLADARFELINRFIGAFRIHSNSITGSGRLNAAHELDVARLEDKLALAMRRHPGSAESFMIRQMVRASNPVGLALRLAAAFGLVRGDFQ